MKLTKKAFEEMKLAKGTVNCFTAFETATAASLDTVLSLNDGKEDCYYLQLHLAGRYSAHVELAGVSFPPTVLTLPYFSFLLDRQIRVHPKANGEAGAQHQVLDALELPHQSLFERPVR